MHGTTPVAPEETSDGLRVSPFNSAGIVSMEADDEEPAAAGRSSEGGEETSRSAGEQGTRAERGAEAREKQASQAERPRKRRSHRSRKRFKERMRKAEAEARKAEAEAEAHLDEACDWGCEVAASSPPYRARSLPSQMRRSADACLSLAAGPVICF